MTETFKLFGGSIHSALIHAATEYDRREAKKKHHNPYALAQYFARIEEVEEDVANGASIRDALIAAFNGRLLDYLLKSVGEPPHSHKPDGRMSYRPVTG